MTKFPETRASLLVKVKSLDDQEAWEIFADTYQPVVYRMARMRGMQDADALDLVQDVLVRVSAAIENFEKRPGVQFRNWLGRIAKNAILSALSRSPRETGEGGPDSNNMLEELPGQPNPLAKQLAEEVRREQFLRAAAIVRADVNRETWLAFERTAIQRMSCEDAALELGKTIGTIYAARSRVFQRLRDQVEEFRREKE